MRVGTRKLYIWETPVPSFEPKKSDLGEIISQNHVTETGHSKSSRGEKKIFYPPSALPPS